MGLNNIDHLALFNTRPNELEVHPTFFLLYININWVLAAKNHLRDIA
jgi:demethoxyubiquinone hydroxylase (CLK1/Coq7/Cat5 family)